MQAKSEEKKVDIESETRSEAEKNFKLLFSLSHCYFVIYVEKSESKPKYKK
jgi:hypothetical protein